MNAPKLSDQDTDAGVVDTGRRGFLKTAAIGAAAGAAGLGLQPSLGRAQDAAAASGAGAPPAGLEITDLTTPISKLKSPLPLEVQRAVWDAFDSRTMNAGGDYSAIYSTRLPQFLRNGMIMPGAERSALRRNIESDLDDLTFMTKDRTPMLRLADYLHEGGPRRVQAMMMAHKGRVVFEAYPGMNPTDLHVWYSASKTTVTSLTTMLEAEGLFSYDDPVTKHAVELQGSIWDDISFRDAANMSAGLDIEESFANYTVPDSWINAFWDQIIFGEGDQWIQLMRAAKPLQGEGPGDRFRYSTANTMTLVLAVQNITQRFWLDEFNARVWSHIGAAAPFAVSMATDGTPISGGFNQSTPEDMIRYAMLYTPSWKTVSDTQVVTDQMLESLRTLGNPSAYTGSTEEGYHLDWFGERPLTNSNQWDAVFEDGAMFKHGNQGQGIYVDPGRDFCGMTFATCPNLAEIDHSPGYLRAAAKALAGG
ncbi:MAG: beta-lactamase family protein [Rhodobacteraceae bacterium]|jgi:CubicO group peptidase (beta-lactamase class C family)|nr:beta-lactamase family protein [Paracoccaceae bacterium]